MSDDVNEVKELHAYINSLHPISEESWMKLQKISERKEIKKGDFFIKEGQIASHIAFLQEGIIRAFYRTEDGQEYNKHFFTEPCFIGGYSSLITGENNLINQQALTDCTIFIIDFKQFQRLFDDCLDIERAARKLAELYFVHKEMREIEIVLLNADKRYELFRKQFPKIEQQIPQYHIASYLGITPTQLSRIRRKFSKY